MKKATTTPHSPTHSPSTHRTACKAREIEVFADRVHVARCWMADMLSGEASLLKWRGYGFSAIHAPGGKVMELAKSLYGSEIIYADLPTQRKTSPLK